MKILAIADIDYETTVGRIRIIGVYGYRLIEFY
jgi:hypothetical protein